MTAQPTTRGADTDPRARVSFWLEDAGDDLSPRPSLDGSTDVDVAILGAGFTGLWTALELLKREPSLRVAVVEREIAGFGASGRNGAWCSGELNIGMDLLAERHGVEAAKAVRRAMHDTVDEVARASAGEGVDAGFRKGGTLLVARGPAEMPALRATAEEYERFGFGEHCRVLDRDGLDQRLRVAGAAGALHLPDCAAVHPGRLVRGLARAVERRGGTIFEQTAVTSFAAGTRTAAGRRPGARRASPAPDPRRRRTGGDGGAGRRGVPRGAAAAAPATASDLLADRAHRAAHRRAVGGDRVAAGTSASRRSG